MEKHVLKIACTDETGLIHKITGVLYHRGLNIIDNSEFVDDETGRFFMRTEVEGKTSFRDVLNKLKDCLPKNAVIEIAGNRKKNVLLFATSEPHCLGDLLIRYAYGELNANVPAVISNKKTLGPLAGRFGIPFFHVPTANKTRELHEAAVLKIVARLKPQFIVLAKYMRILSERFVSRFKNRIINIHHSFLPAFAGANPYAQAKARGVKIIGATAHFVTAELDNGPIIAQDVISIDHSHSITDMTKYGRDVEKIVLAKALKLALEDRIFISGNKTIIFD